MKRTKTSSSLFLFHSPSITDYFQTIGDFKHQQSAVKQTCTSSLFVLGCNGTVKFRALWVCWKQIRFVHAKPPLGSLHCRFPLEKNGTIPLLTFTLHKRINSAPINKQALSSIKPTATKQNPSKALYI
jgi:hypothetical protein